MIVKVVSMTAATTDLMFKTRIFAFSVLTNNSKINTLESRRNAGYVSNQRNGSINIEILLKQKFHIHSLLY